MDLETGVVSRVNDVYIPFTCAYNRTGHVDLRAYELQNYQLNKTEESEGKYAFSLDIYMYVIHYITMYFSTPIANFL